MMLLTNNKDGLARFTKMVKVPEMIISVLFLATGVYMLTQIPEIKSFLIIKIVAVLVSIPLAIIGFKKGNKALAVISFLLLITAFGLAEMSKKQKSGDTTEQVAPGENATLNAEDIYTANCAKCHGDDGKSALLGASDLSISTLDANAKIEIVKHGKGVMTPFEGILNDEQIGAVIGYIETLKK
jgi:mono/diheme cytochrome c family protein